jgi:plastocyanin
MISSRCDMDTIVLATSIVFILLMISLVGLDHFETLAQETNATTSSTDTTSKINATSSSGGGTDEVSVIMPLGSSNSTVQTGYGPGYDPFALIVSPGAKVIWDNQDSVVHASISGNPLTVRPDGKFDTGLVGANQTSKPITMPLQPGEYRYFCTVHPFLSGTILVHAQQGAQSSLAPPSLQQQPPFTQS